MTRGEIEAQILKNLIMNSEYITQDELKKIVKAMEKPQIEIRPYNPSEEVEKR